MKSLSNQDISHKIIEKLNNNPGMSAQVLDLIVEIIMDEEGVNLNAAYEDAEVRIKSVVRHLDGYIGECISKYVEPGVNLNQDHTMIKSVDIGSVAPLRAQVVEFLQRGIDDKAFEEVCRMILQHFSVGKLSVRKRPDGGWDFDGILNVHSQKGVASTMFFDWDIKVIGQAKRFSNTVHRPEVDAFVGVAKRKRDEDKTYIPTIFIFMATCDFSKGARDLAQTYRIITKDGDQLAEVILKERIGLRYKENKPIWDCEEFLEWLSKCKTIGTE